MPSLLKSTWNTRWLPTGDKKYMRTDCPLHLTDEEVQFLKDNNVLTVVDLREAVEYNVRQCRLEKEPGFTYLHLPVSGGDRVPETFEETLEAYKFMVDEKMNLIIETILNAETGVIYFCAAGKDRTGVTSALILKKLGFDEDLIIKDYMTSKDNLLEFVKPYLKENPDFIKKFIMPREEYIKAVLK